MDKETMEERLFWVHILRMAIEKTYKAKGDTARKWRPHVRKIVKYFLKMLWMPPSYQYILLCIISKHEFELPDEKYIIHGKQTSTALFKTN
jgi:hypothetical protein